jgi:hypothetical protein
MTVRREEFKGMRRAASGTKVMPDGSGASAKLVDQFEGVFMSTQRYYIVVDNLAKARGPVGELSFTGESPDDFAAQLQRALREPALFQQWKALQPDPDAIDDSMGSNDSAATVTAKQHDLRCDVTVTTKLPHSIVKHRLSLLIGRNWTLRDVTAG